MKKKRLSFCNVLESSPAARRLWHFQVERDKIRLQREEPLGPAAPLPEKAVAKDWSNLWQPRLNVAWLPPQHVFFRVVQLPGSDRLEILSMLEFQLEKLSPLPVAQVLWTAEVMPSLVENQMTAIVCVAPRDVVEAHLGRLEEAHFQPDRLEVPLLTRIVADGPREDGAWLYPGSGDAANICMVAWWTGGVLQQLQLLRLPDVPAGTVSPSDLLTIQAGALHEQLMQIAWAGELEGWLNLPVKWHLAGDEELVRLWEPLVAPWGEEAAAVAASASNSALAHFSAERAVRQEDGANLLPPEYAAKYRQRYIDKLWMGGLGAVVSAYIVCVIIYMIALQVYSFRQAQLQAKVVSLQNTYTNVLQLKEQVQVLQDQFNLKYAALDSFKVTAEMLPPDFTLTWLMFGRGGTLELHGTAPQGQEQKITEFNESIRGAAVDGQSLFREVSGPNIISRPGAQNVTWNFQGRLNLLEE